jgi:hypothetical protein
VEAAGTADGGDDGAGIASAIIAVREFNYARPRMVEMLCGLRGNSKPVASGAAVLLPVS